MFSKYNVYFAIALKVKTQCILITKKYAHYSVNNKRKLLRNPPKNYCKLFWL